MLSGYRSGELRTMRCMTLRLSIGARVIISMSSLQNAILKRYFLFRNIRYAEKKTVVISKD